MVVFVVVSFIALILFGMPIAFALGISGIATILIAGDLPLMLVPHRMVTQLDSYSLLAVPYFVLAGYLMEKGGISERLFDFANALTRHWRGGLAQSAMGASIVMSGLSGSGVADISAVGGVAVPGMTKKGYRREFTAAVLAAGGFLGPIIPPSILMIIYGSITGMSIGALFIAGIIPGLLYGAGFMAIIWWRAGRLGYLGEKRATLSEVGRSFIAAFWSLFAPILLIGGIIVGAFTPTEAGAVATVYALFVGFLIHRSLKLKDIPGILLQTGLMTGTILIIIATAALFGWLLERMHFPAAVAGFLTNVSDDPAIVMLLIILILLAVGCVVEVLAAAIVLVPVLDPLAVHFGYDPLHFAFVIVLALSVGTVTPPVGVYLFLASNLAGARLSDSIREVIPYIVVMIVGLLLCAYIPALSTWLPGLFHG
jgi:tripartite ATP-independent transporter DctM subunit